jgi:hypothetical protein
MALTLLDGVAAPAVLIALRYRPGAASQSPAAGAAFKIGGWLEPAPLAFIFGTLLGLFAACGAGIGLPAVLVSRWVPGLRQFAGNVMLLFATIPWVVILILFFLIVIRV